MTVPCHVFSHPTKIGKWTLLGICSWGNIFCFGASYFMFEGWNSFLQSHPVFFLRWLFFTEQKIPVKTPNCFWESWPNLVPFGVESLPKTVKVWTAKKLPSTKLTWLAGKWTRSEDGFPIESGNFPASYVSLLEGMLKDLKAFWLLIYRAEHWPFHWLEYVCEPTNIHMATMVESLTINSPPQKNKYIYIYIQDQNKLETTNCFRITTPT